KWSNPKSSGELNSDKRDIVLLLVVSERRGADPNAASDRIGSDQAVFRLRYGVNQANVGAKQTSAAPARACVAPPAPRPPGAGGSATDDFRVPGVFADMTAPHMRGTDVETRAGGRCRDDR